MTNALGNAQGKLHDAGATSGQVRHDENIHLSHRKQRQRHSPLHAHSDCVGGLWEALQADGRLTQIRITIK